jgi:hypothetical protein
MSAAVNNNPLPLIKIDSSSNRPENNGKDKCAMCLQLFEQGQDKWTHAGGEKHDPFHKECIESWVKRVATNPRCPLDHTRIDPSALVSSKERAFSIIKNEAAYVLQEHVPALLFGITVTGITMAIGMGIERAIDERSYWRQTPVATMTGIGIVVSLLTIFELARIGIILRRAFR